MRRRVALGDSASGTTTRSPAQGLAATASRWPPWGCPRPCVDHHAGGPRCGSSSAARGLGLHLRPRGGASSTSPSSSTVRATQTSLRTDFMRLSGHLAIPRVTARATWCITATAARSTLSMRYTERLADAGIALQRVRQRPRKQSWSVQDGGDSSGPWRHIDAVEFAHARVGRLVQHPAVTGTDRLHPAGGVRRALL